MPNEILCERDNNGIFVALLWNPSTGKTSIDLEDIRDEMHKEFLVPAEEALDAFYHPFIYAPTNETDNEEAENSLQEIIDRLNYEFDSEPKKKERNSIEM